MPPRAIHQVAPAFYSGDAISNQMAKMRALFRAWGYTSQVYAPVRDQRIPDPGLDLDQYISHPQNILIYHYSTYTPLSVWVNSLPELVIFYYHNVTPPEFFAPYAPDFATQLARGRHEVRMFNGRSCAWAGSDYNRADLLAAGFRQVDVLPYFLYFDALIAAEQTETAQRIVKMYADGSVNWLFVGRLAPNKCQDDIIRAFTYYHRCINSNSRLFLIGAGDLAPYRARLEYLVERNVPDHIYLPGAVSLEALSGYYKAASVFVSMSEHEGFGIPLIEAMTFDLPVIAFNAAAVPDTLGQAGILVNHKDYAVIAELVELLMQNAQLREHIILRQRARVAALDPAQIETLLHTLIEQCQKEFGY